VCVCGRECRAATPPTRTQQLLHHLPLPPLHSESAPGSQLLSCQYLYCCTRTASKLPHDLPPPVRHCLSSHCRRLLREQHPRRQHASAYASICQLMSAYVSIRQHTSACRRPADAAPAAGALLACCGRRAPAAAACCCCCCCCCCCNTRSVARSTPTAAATNANGGHASAGERGHAERIEDTNASSQRADRRAPNTRPR
jgi:hypothetical protein